MFLNIFPLIETERLKMDAVFICRGLALSFKNKQKRQIFCSGISCEQQTQAAIVTFLTERMQGYKC